MLQRLAGGRPRPVSRQRYAVSSDFDSVTPAESHSGAKSDSVTQSLSQEGDSNFSAAIPCCVA